MIDFETELTMAISCILLIVAFFGNIISIIIFRNEELKKHSSSFYLIILFILNIFLVINLPFTTIPSIWTFNAPYCKFFIGFINILPQLQGWILCFCSVDRLCLVVKPHSFKFKNKFIFKIILLFITVIVTFILFSPVYYFYSDFKDSNNQTKCFYPSNLISIYSSVEIALFKTVLPFSIMIISCILISLKLFKRSNRINFTVAPIQQNHSNNNYKKDVQFVKTVLFLDLLFILFRLPRLIYSLIFQNDNSFLFTLPDNLLLCFEYIYCSFYFLFLLIFNKIYR